MTWRGYAPTPAGSLFFVVDDLTLISASFRESSDSSMPLRKKSLVHESISRYFDGDLNAFDDLDVSQQGTEFTTSVYEHMRAIPPGDVATYGELANRAGHPRAARAVGTVCARNEVVLIVPCHRVVSSNGLGGYAYGLDLKRILLTHEGVDY